MNADELRRTFALANAFKEGDLLVGGTRDDAVREDARRALHATRIADIRRSPLIDDGITAALDRSRNRRLDGDLDPLTIGHIKSLLLGAGGASWAVAHLDALPSEVAAAVVKIMTDDELASVASKIFNSLPGAIGASDHFGSRIQPNSPGDDEDEILFSILEGLAHGCGDVIIGLNPAADDLDTIIRLEQLLEGVVQRLALPTRYCVLSDIVKQHRASERAHVDVGFQSLAGTSRALAGMVGLDVDALGDLTGAFSGLYFETGQGSAVTNGAAEGIDMVTLEARAYGVARHLQRRRGQWTIVNDVAGFIGPEVFRTTEQLERACLEDLLMAKLHGLTMGLDVCATFHMGVPPRALREVTEHIVRRAAPAYLMAVAGHADPMLGYLTTSFRQHVDLRGRTARVPTSAMQRRLTALGAMDAGGRPSPGPETVARLYALYAAARGDRRSADSLADEGRTRLTTLRERGFELGFDPVKDGPSSDARLQGIYEHARAALYASADEGVIRDACPAHLRVRTMAADRDDYLAHPSHGETLRADDRPRVAALARPERSRRAASRAAHVQMVIADGLNANAINEHLRAVLLPLRRSLLESGCHPGDVDVVVQNGRVRAGYQVGALTGADVIVSFVGERPGTGLNTMSAYLTYGRDEAGRFRWDPGMDHAWTTAVCGIHPRGKPPETAALEISRIIRRMFDQRRSGIALTSG